MTVEWLYGFSCFFWYIKGMGTKRTHNIGVSLIIVVYI